MPSVHAAIRVATADDFGAIAAIYNHYVLHTTISFEEREVPVHEMAARWQAVVDAGLPWLVADVAGEVAGYAYAGPWKARAAYRHSAESTVYVAADRVGRGLGAALYEALFAELRARPLRVVIGGIALPNAASVALHERMGMRKVAHFAEVGFKFGRWIDVAYFQAAL
ncbi:MAG: N-acetyltransferase [Proteobacteria bacterium]|nr:N-acetyltransferase [Pseudomonadota bacterium]